MPTVLFLCTGNYYRSRFAEMYFNDLAARRGLSWRAVSRGMRQASPELVGPISPLTIERLQTHGIACENLRDPQESCEADLLGADLIIALKEMEHRPMMQRKFPHLVERVRYWHVHDLDCAPAEQALAEIEQLIGELIDQLPHNNAGG
jgi:protein-tyrosine phosphatase